MSEEHYGQKHIFSSGVEVVILPFPSLRMEKFQRQVNEKFPLPKMPKKTIKVLNGTELVDNPTNKKYQVQFKAVNANQEQWLSEKILNGCLRDCIELDLSLYENEIAAIEEDNDEPYPENPVQRKKEFLIDYVIRATADFKNLITIATSLMNISEAEVEKELTETFPADVE